MDRQTSVNPEPDFSGSLTSVPPPPAEFSWSRAAAEIECRSEMEVCASGDGDKHIETFSWSYKKKQIACRLMAVKLALNGCEIAIKANNSNLMAANGY